MPGYLKERFVDLNNNDCEDLSCGICLDVLKNPKVVTCCRQMYCFDCINEWLNTNNSCPNDRKTLSSTSLSNPPLIVNNMIMRLKIRCDFSDNGCDSVIKLEELHNHVIQCKFDPNKACIDCGFTGNKAHNCVNEMKDIIKSIKFENKVLRNGIITERHCNLIEKYALKSAKESIIIGSKPVIHKEKDCPQFNPVLKQNIIEIIKKSVIKHSTVYEISEDISNRLSLRESGDHVWQVIVLIKHIGNYFVYPKEYCFIVGFGSLKFVIFSTGVRN